MKKVRTWALLALVLEVGVGASCRRFSQRQQVPDVSSLPADTMVVVSVDTSRLREAPLYKNLNPEPGQVKTFLQRLGINPDRDLDQMIFAFRGSAEGGTEWYALLRGRFDSKRIDKGMEEPGARMSVETYRRRNIYNLVRVPDIGDLSFAVVDAGAVALGKSESIRMILDVGDKAAPSLVTNDKMMKLVAGLDPRAQIWGVMDGKELMRVAEKRRESLSGTFPQPALKNLSSVVDGRLWAVVTEDLGISLEIGSSSEKGAKNLADAIRGILAFARMGTERGDPETASLIESIGVKDMGKSVRIGVDLPGDKILKLRNRLRSAPAVPVPVPP
jgi:hypothetical protein